MEIILETIIVLIFQYPGAFLRWIFLSKKSTFKSLLKEDPYINATISLLVIGGLAMAVKYIFFSSN